MGDNFLQLNDNKTEVIYLAPPHFLESFNSNLGPLRPNICSQVKILGVMFDKQKNSDFRASFFQLLNLF